MHAGKELQVAGKSSRNAASLGGRLRAFREKLCLRQTEMAQFLDISASLYTKLESGNCGTSPRTVARIAAKLNVTPDYLLHGVTPAAGNGRHRVDAAANMPAAPGDELARMPDETLRTMIRLILHPQLRTLAGTVGGNLEVNSAHALALVVRTVMMDTGGGLAAAILGEDDKNGQG